MDSLERNQTTATQARLLEDSKCNPFRPHELHSHKYFRLLAARRLLQVSSRRQEFLDVYHDSQIVIVSGETGSGKTTQIPQFILFDEYESGKRVACTQPRRLATTSVAARTAEELDVPLGDVVGYSVRFDNKTNDKTILRYMTDGLLLSEAKTDRDFSSYSCVIIDEAHERTMPTDILLALLKMAASRRPDLKIRSYFPTAAAFDIAGKIHPVHMQYLVKATPRYTFCAISVAVHIHKMMPSGDILVFLPTSGDVEMACSALSDEHEDITVLPLYSALSRARQQEIFEESEYRKCIFATNIAETSITIDGIVYVIDSGLENRPVYNPRLKVSTMLISPISKASAKQRAGRAGRTKPGICFRLYTEETFDMAFIPSAPPAILSGEITSQILLLKTMGFDSIGKFDFIDPPHPEVYLRGLQDLHAMGYIDDKGAITPRGGAAAQLYVHPKWYNAFVEGHRNGCYREMIELAAIESTQHSIFSRPPSVKFAADVAHERFACPLSDHISQLNALHAFESAMKTDTRLNIGQWCFDALLNRRALSEVVRIRDQLTASLQGVPVNSTDSGGFYAEDYDRNVRKTLARSFYYQCALRNPKEPIDVYRTVHDNHAAGIHPDSALVSSNHEWIVYSHFVHTGTPYLQTVTAVDPEWLIDLEFFQDDNLPKADEGGFGQPRVKTSLDKAREKREMLRGDLVAFED